jgi:hypothetical protein
VWLGIPFVIPFVIAGVAVVTFGIRNVPRYRVVEELWPGS